MVFPNPGSKFLCVNMVAVNMLLCVLFVSGELFSSFAVWIKSEKKLTITYCCFLYHYSYVSGYFLCTFWNVTDSLNSICVIFLKFM